MESRKRVLINTLKVAGVVVLLAIAANVVIMVSGQSPVDKKEVPRPEPGQNNDRPRAPEPSTSPGHDAMPYFDGLAGKHLLKDSILEKDVVLMDRMGKLLGWKYSDVLTAIREESPIVYKGKDAEFLCVYGYNKADGFYEHGFIAFDRTRNAIHACWVRKGCFKRVFSENRDIYPEDFENDLP